MGKIDIDNIFENKMPWIVRYGLIISVIFIAAVVALMLIIGNNNFNTNFSDYLKIIGV